MTLRCVITHRCLCPQLLNTLPTRTHGPAAALNINRLFSPPIARNFSTPSESTIPEKTLTQETETSTDKIENQYSGFRIRKVALTTNDGNRRAVRERYTGNRPMVFRSPELTGIDKVADLGRRSMYPGVFKAAEELVRGGYVPDTKLYAVLIEACGNFQGCLLQPLAFRLFEEMKARGLQVNSEIYHSLLKVGWLCAGVYCGYALCLWNGMEC